MDYIISYLIFSTIMGYILGALFLIAGIALAVYLWKKHNKTYAFVGFIFCFFLSATAIGATTFTSHVVQNYLLK